MSLDFTVSELTDGGLDSQGRQTFVRTNLEEFTSRTGYTLMDYGLGSQENCTTKSYDAVEFLRVLDEMQKDLDKINETGEDEFKQKADLETAIDALQCFIEQEHITEDTERVFDIHIWY